MCGLAYIGLVLGSSPPLGWMLLLKPVPVVGLILWVRSGPRDRLRDGVLAGLGLALCGDIALIFPGEQAFLAGLGLNLLAHVAYIVAFTAGSPPLRPGLGLLMGLWIVALVAHLWPGLGPMAGPVSAYGAAIGVMMWRAAARVSRERAAWLGALGALGFGVCDSLIALDRFGQPIAGVALPIMASYWLGQWGIAASARSRALDLPTGTP